MGDGLQKPERDAETTERMILKSRQAREAEVRSRWIGLVILIALIIAAVWAAYRFL
jgi:hypothetical protein